MKNSKNWNRILTGAAAVSLAIGTMAPMAFAASASTQYNTRTMNVGSGFTAVVSGLVAQDQGHATEFLPIYYLMQGLGKLGYTVNWNGGTRVLNITTPTGVTVTAPTATVGTPGPDQMVIQLNGTAVQLAPRVVAKDPASGVVTTFAPIYYLNNALKSAGFTNTYNGSSWTLSGQAASQTGTLGSITVANASSGDGSSANPAVSLNGSAVSISTTLKDANGNPLTNTAVTFNVSNYGNYPTLPTVENTSGTVLSGTAQSTAEQYTVYTNANGVATISMTGPSGQTYAYEVTASAPYAGANSSAVTSAPSYVEFVASGQVGLSPYAQSSTSAYAATLGTPVPITVTLPPNSAGQAQANVLVTLTTNNHASFVSSSGAFLGQTIQVSTNSAGIAQAYLSDSIGETVSVSVSGLPIGLNAPNSTYISFAQTGVPAKINNFSISSTQPNIGQNVIISGQLEDAAGNPVANGQVLVTAPNGGSHDFAYASGTTTTTFPLISSVTSGTPASSAYGDVVTADSAGNFSFEVTDTRVEQQTYSVYSVVNGQVQNALSVPSGDSSITFNQSTALATLSVGATDSYVQGNSSTTLTGIAAQENGGSITGNGLGTDPMNNSNSQIADVYVEPQNSAGDHTGGVLNGTALTYSVSASNGGQIYSINGVSLSSPASAVTVQYNGGTTVGGGNFTVNGVTINSLASPAQPSDFEVGVINSNTGGTTLTIQSGSVSSTATVNFNATNPVEVANFSPVMGTVNAGQQQQVSFQVQDINGNPVPNTASTILTNTTPSTADPFWITQVNGVTLQEQLNMGTTSNVSYATESTPIPLGAIGTWGSGLNYGVSMPGVVSWNYTKPSQITVYSNASGNVTLTLQAGGMTYPTLSTSTSASGNPNNVAVEPTSNSPSNGKLAFWSDTNPDAGTYPLYIGINGPTGIAKATSFTAQGYLGWNGTSGTTAPSSSSTASGVTLSAPSPTQAYAVASPSIGYVNFGSVTTGDNLTVGVTNFVYGTSAGQFTTESGLISDINADNTLGNVPVTASQNTSNSSIINLSNSTASTVTLTGSTNLTTSGTISAGTAVKPGIYTFTVNSSPITQGTLTVTLNNNITVTTGTIAQFASTTTVATDIAAALNANSTFISTFGSGAATATNNVVTITNNSSSTAVTNVTVN